MSWFRILVRLSQIQNLNAQNLVISKGLYGTGTELSSRVG